jgi:hypothetical protein
VQPALLPATGQGPAGCFTCAGASVVTARDAVATEGDPNDVTEQTYHHHGAR